MTTRTSTHPRLALLATAALVAAACGARGNLYVDGAGGAAGTTNVTTATGASAGGAGGAGVPACQPGDAPVKLATGVTSPAGLALDAEYVYFATGHEGCQTLPGVNRVSKLGGSVEVLDQTAHSSGAIAVGGGDVYWSDDPISQCTKPADQGFAIFAEPLGGGGKTVRFPFAGDFVPAADIALDDANVYWATFGAAAVRRAAKGGGMPEVVDGASTGAVALALFGDSVYWTGAGAGVVAKAPKTGGGTTPLVSTFLPGTTLGGIAVDATGVYYGGASPCQGADCGIMGFITRVGLAGGSQTAIAGGTDEQPHRVAVDGGHVYWTLSKQGDPQVLLGAVMRADEAGGNVTKIAPGRAPYGLAVDEACVYWSDTADGSIWRAPK